MGDVHPVVIRHDRTSERGTVNVMNRRTGVIAVALLALGACGGGEDEAFDWEAALIAADDDLVVADAAATLCAELDGLAYEMAIAMAIDEGRDDLVAAALAGCPKQP